MGWIRRFFKGLALALLCLVPTMDVSAQTWAEFFKQKKTQKKYLLNQIAALQVYIGYARKGYELVDNGLQAVRDITSGEFSLHNAFISSLKQVSPAVRNDLRVAEIISMQLSVLRLSGSWGDHELLSAGSRAYVAAVSSALRDQCLDALEELLMVITAGKVEMGDQERLRRIAELYELMQKHYGFAKGFTTEVNLLVRSRERELLELEEMEGHYE